MPVHGCAGAWLPLPGREYTKGRPRHVLKGHTDTIVAAAFLFDGKAPTPGAVVASGLLGCFLFARIESESRIVDPSDLEVMFLTVLCDSKTGVWSRDP